MTEREATLLTGLVALHISTGQPVGSVALAKRLRLNRSPATIRSDLHELEANGYIYQPHTSAGRIPTDRGYRFFVDHVRQRRMALQERASLQRKFSQLLLAHQQLARITARFLAEVTDTPALSSQDDPPQVFEAGLPELIHQSTESSFDELKELTALLKKLDARLSEHPLPPTAAQASVFIGEEIPFMLARYSSMVVRDVTLRDGQTMTLVIVGKKRMPYQRNVALLNAVADIIEQQNLPLIS